MVIQYIAFLCFSLPFFLVAADGPASSSSSHFSEHAHKGISPVLQKTLHRQNTNSQHVARDNKKIPGLSLLWQVDGNNPKRTLQLSPDIVGSIDFFKGMVVKCKPQKELDVSDYIDFCAMNRLSALLQEHSEKSSEQAFDAQKIQASARRLEKTLRCSELAGLIRLADYLGVSKVPAMSSLALAACTKPEIYREIERAYLRNLFEKRLSSRNKVIECCREKIDRANNDSEARFWHGVCLQFVEQAAVQVNDAQVVEQAAVQVNDAQVVEQAAVQVNDAQEKVLDEQDAYALSKAKVIEFCRQKIDRANNDSEARFWRGVCLQFEQPDDAQEEILGEQAAYALLSLLKDLYFELYDSGALSEFEDLMSGYAVPFAISIQDFLNKKIAIPRVETVVRMDEEGAPILENGNPVIDKVSLDLSGRLLTSLDGLEEIPGVADVTHVNLDGNRLAGPGILEKIHTLMPRVKSISLKSNNLTNDDLRLPNGVFILSRLRELALDDNLLTSSEHLLARMMAEDKRLVNLSVCNNRLDPESIQHLIDQCRGVTFESQDNRRYKMRTFMRIGANVALAVVLAVVWKKVLKEQFAFEDEFSIVWSVCREKAQVIIPSLYKKIKQGALSVGKHATQLIRGFRKKS